MSESRPGLLEKMGPLGFLISIVALAAILAFVNNRPSDSVVVDDGAPTGAMIASGSAETGDGAADETGAATESAAAVEQPDTDAATAEVSPTGGGAATPEPVESVQPVESFESVVNTGQSTTGAVEETQPPAAEADDTYASGTAIAATATESPVASSTTEGAAEGADTAPTADHGGGAPSPAADSPGFVVSNDARRLMDTARQDFGDGAGIVSEDGTVNDTARTRLVTLIDGMTQNPSLVLGIAARLDDTFGILSFPSAERRALALRRFFEGHGIDAGRIVAGVLVPDYEPDDGVERVVSFFVAERRR